MVNSANNRGPHNKQKGKHGTNLVLMLGLFMEKCSPKRLHEIILGRESWLREPMLSLWTWVTPFSGVSYVPYCCGQIPDKKRLKRRKVYSDSQFKWIMVRKTWRQVEKASWREIEANWLQLHLQSGSRGRTGSGAGLWSFKAHHQWPTSSSQVPHPKGSTTFSCSIRSWRPTVQAHEPVWTVQFVLKLPDWVTSILHQNSTKET